MLKTKILQFNPLIHRIFLDYDIIFHYWTTVKQIQEKFNKSFEDFWKCYRKWSILFQIYDISKASKGVIME